MRAFAIIFMALLFGSSLWISGCASTGGGGGGTAERIIRAEPSQIMASVGRGFEAEGLELISRSDIGDIYQGELSAEQLRELPALAQLAEHGAMTLRARVSRSQIEFTSSFPNTEMVVGFTVALSPAADGEGTLARLEPLLRGTVSEEERRRFEALSRNFGSRGEQLLEGIASSAES
jgi:hypothetical protein